MEVARSESEMLRPGQFFYHTASVIAGLIALWVVWGYIYDAEKGEPIVQVVPLLLAGAIWLLAWLGRDFLAER
jgi:hypothetical protein